MTSSLNRLSSSARQVAEIDRKLSARHLDLDPAGYFVIFVDSDEGLIYAKHYGIVVNERGLAIDPATGKPLPAKGEIPTQLLQTFSGRSAKELSVAVFEQTDPIPVSQLGHAAYLGREFQKAETALIDGSPYIQD
ncbi:DUF4346 domain-containing protein [Synechococcus sp. PCC 7336]|uniref:DUF4346 domain-containing protein n=1 Tax=Synechococcus sp. PCC 7336 TaxID=195250 RepID=UPI00034565B2|nr:DUF4346 domain-containing protein [Synechococcus sp. PCC 7336]